MRYRYRGFSYRRNPEGVVGGLTGAATSAIRPSYFLGNVTSGAQTAIGYAGVSAVGSALNRIGVGAVLSRVPPGVLQTLLGYVVKGFSVGVVGVLARTAGLDGGLGANIRAGAKANFGVTLLRDVAGVIPGGERVRAFLSGMGNYFQADGWPAMGDYLNAQMQPTLPPPQYGATQGIYGRGSDIYGGEGAVFN